MSDYRKPSAHEKFIVRKDEKMFHVLKSWFCLKNKSPDPRALCKVSSISEWYISDKVPKNIKICKCCFMQLSVEQQRDILKDL